MDIKLSSLLLALSLKFQVLVSKHLYELFLFFFFWFAYHSIQGFAPTNLLVDPRRTPGLVGESPNGDFLHTQALEPESPSNLLKRYQAAYHLDQPPLVYINPS